jgi:aspartyl-tRNA synthetase
MKILIENVESFLNKEIVLEGWLKNKRDHGNLLFLELRD